MRESDRADDGRRKDAPMISRKEIEALGRYNAEVARGILHTPEHVARMADMQRRFDVWGPVFMVRARPRRRWRRLLIWRRPG